MRIYFGSPEKSTEKKLYARTCPYGKPCEVVSVYCQNCNHCQEVLKVESNLFVKRTKVKTL